MMKVLDLYSGIGGFSLGLERTGGFETVAFCEIDPYCQKVLKKHWPDVPIENDVTKLRGDKYRANVVVGGFPCQPASLAGKRGGTDDDRWLWNENMRIIREGNFDWCIFENVPGLLSLVQYSKTPPVDGQGHAIGEVGETYDRVGRFVAAQCMEDLEHEGFSVQPFVIPALSLDANHLRYRLWIIAYNDRGTGKKAKPREAKPDLTECRTTNSKECNIRAGLCACETEGERGRRSCDLPGKGYSANTPGIGQQRRCDRVRDTRETVSTCSRSASRGASEQSTPADTECWQRSLSGYFSGMGREWEQSQGIRVGKFTSQPLVCRGTHGIPHRMDRLRSLGNSVVPQIVQALGLFLLEVEHETKLPEM